VSRLEGLSDAVFALCLTLLFLTDGELFTASEVETAMWRLVPFAACFAILVMIWHDHYLFFRRYGLRDGWTRFLNALLLFLVLAYVHPLRWIFLLLAELFFGIESEVSYDRPVRVMTVYSAGFAAVYTSFALLYRHAYRMREELQLDPLEQHVTRQHRSEKQIVAAFGAASVAVSLSDYVLPVEWATAQSAAGWMYFAIGPLLATHAILWQRARERLRVDIAAVGSAAAQST